MQNDDLEVECTICGAKVQQPCRDQETHETLEGGYHVGRLTGGQHLTVIWDEDLQAFNTLEN